MAIACAKTWPCGLCCLHAIHEVQGYGYHYYIFAFAFAREQHKRRQNTFYLIALRRSQCNRSLWSRLRVTSARKCNFRRQFQIVIIRRSRNDFTEKNVSGFFMCVNWPRIYIIVKQLSNANPTTKRHNVNVTKLFEYPVKTPPTKPKRFEPTSAGMRPYRSATQPNSKPPTIAPQKNTDWAIDGNAAFSQTHSNCKQSELLIFAWLRLIFSLCVYLCGDGWIWDFVGVEFPTIIAWNRRPVGIRFLYAIGKLFGEIDCVHETLARQSIRLWNAERNTAKKNCKQEIRYQSFVSILALSLLIISSNGH